MNENLTRGYTILGTMAYVDKNYDEGKRNRFLSTLSPVVRDTIGGYKPVEWYDRIHFVELLRGIASLQATEQNAYKELVRCGQSVAELATNTFLKLFMKILTPTLFAKKIPDIWLRDNKSGRFTADLSRVDQNILRMHLMDVAGYDHVGPVAVGWITFAMGRMGKQGLDCRLSGWSLATPGPKDLYFDITWQ